MSVETLMSPRAMGSPNRVQRLFKRVLVSTRLVVVTEEACGCEVADPDTEVEEGGEELGVVSEEEGDDDAEGGEYY